MSVASLAPANSQRSRATAVKSFEDFLAKKEVTLTEVHRPEQGVTKQAPPCTKKDIKTIISALYMHASANSDYLDAVLVALMWYLYGRGSEAEQLEKAQLCVYRGSMIFLRFKRVKTASQQGISLFKGPNNPFTCPLHVLAVALALQPAPGTRIFPQFAAVPALSASDDQDDDGELGLIAQLDRELAEAPTCKTPQPCRANLAPGAQAYINRLLVTVSGLPAAKESGLTKGLTSHSFRRGGAMHANADSRISPNWVVERGGWNMSRVSKAFSYMLNTTHEDQQIARQLSGWNPQAGARLPDLTALDGVVRARVEKLQDLLFAAVTGFPTVSWNLDPQVLEVLMATLILHFPEMERHRLDSPYVRRIHEALGVLNIQASELLAWSITLRAAFNPPAEEKQETVSQQLDELLLRQTRVEERLAVLGANAESIDKKTNTTEQQHEDVEQSQPKRARKRASKALSAVWFEWFTAVPRMYESITVSKAILHESRRAVAFMMLCLPSGFKLDPASPAYKAEVHAVGVEAEKKTLEYLAAQGSQAVAVGSVVKAMRVLHKAGHLSVLLDQFRERYYEGEGVDPTPNSALPPFLRFT
ncbi:hypothetical protein PHYSODRAFT_331893 [Phytophthora sojae]|uniref:Uncharacterized protein n=1 Tax=Phytophthora sojae (strain P6497) TaxID=1094619 RepID=G4ZGA2_PHYSP|nr:hypothetical protein PHYSODRAFT_331893 [Phytophthora sojae]EGZ18005.1 hypothetical protein PHYSODRAFT_331893 [Phytophthora sojae]|eukprot:XP_009527063.1 hypothetical protein PHYSODRAFT_331893 [Phytophthora sojae]